MTISTQVRKAGPYVGTGSQTVFSFAFKVFSASDVLVVRTVGGVDVYLTLTAQYTVTLNADQETSPGGYITTTTAYDAATRITILSNVVPLQPTSIPNGGPFFARVVERAFDRLTILIQQTLERVNRTIQLPLTDPATGATLPLPAERAGKALVFDAVGNLVASTDFWANQAAASAANASAAALSATNAAASAALVTNRFYGAASADPATRPDGTARVAGDSYFNTGTLVPRYWTGSTWANYQTPTTTPGVQVTWTGSTGSAAVESSGINGSTGLVLGNSGATVDANIGGAWNGTTGVFTAPTDGWYGWNGAAQMNDSAQPAALQGIYVYPYIDGSPKLTYRQAVATGGKPGAFAGRIRLTAGQTLQLRAFCGSIPVGADRVVPSGWLTIVFQGP